MAFCANCGKEMSDLAVACPNCGHPNPAQAATTTTTYASYGARIGAYLIDGIIISVPSFIIMGALSIGFARDRIRIDESGSIVEGGGTLGAYFAALAISGLMGILYKVLLEGGPRGQTLGKMALKIAVRDADGKGSIGYGRALIRWIVTVGLWFFLYLPGIIDLLFPLWDARKQTIHDKAARSIVVAA